MGQYGILIFFYAIFVQSVQPTNGQDSGSTHRHSGKEVLGGKDLPSGNQQLANGGKDLAGTVEVSIQIGSDDRMSCDENMSVGEDMGSR